MFKQKEEIAAISANRDEPTFGNTIDALEQTGLLLDRANAVFNALTSAETNEKLQAIAKELAPLQSAHRDSILLDQTLFGRIKVVWDKRSTLVLTPEQGMLLERTYKRFVRGGALLHGPQKERLRAINSELASLSVRFGDNLLKEINQYRLVVEQRDRLAGLSETQVTAAAEAANKAGLAGKWVFTLHAPSLWPFLQFSADRELRRQLFAAYTSRGRHGEATETKGLAARTAFLRTEKARLLGHNTWADFVLEENMAGNPGKVYELLERLWGPAKAVGTSKPMSRISASNLGIGSITRRKCARPSINWTSRPYGPISSWRTCATERSGWQVSCTASPSRNSRTCRFIIPM
jgi:peptidyl-dipeptidase Dcp